MLSVGPPFAFPPEVQQLVPSYRAFGTVLPKERRLRFMGLVALCGLVAETSENSQDALLCAELIALGRRFGLP
jgi:hypothetical protein